MTYNVKYINSGEPAPGALERTQSSYIIKTSNPLLQSRLQNFVYNLDFKPPFNMRFLLPITISLASVAIAFTLPAGLTSGTHAAYYNTTGHEVHVKTSELNWRDIGSYTPVHRAKRSNANVIGKRQDLGDSGYDIYCGCGLNLITATATLQSLDWKPSYRARWMAD
jgi:hypothetical protein